MIDLEEEYKRVSIRIQEIYEDLINGEGVTECLEELIKEMRLKLNEVNQSTR